MQISNHLSFTIKYKKIFDTYYMQYARANNVMEGNTVNIVCKAFNCESCKFLVLSCDGSHKRKKNSRLSNDLVGEGEEGIFYLSRVTHFQVDMKAFLVRVKKISSIKSNKFTIFTKRTRTLNKYISLFSIFSVFLI